MAVMAVVISEFLCFLFNKYGKCADMNIKSVLLNFYDETEIATAKELLYSELEKINCTGLPRLVKRRPSDNKANLDIDDIFGFIAKADEAGVMDQLPPFTAANLDRVPHMKPEDLDIYVLAKTVVTEAKKLAALQEVVKKHLQDGHIGATNVNGSVPVQSLHSVSDHVPVQSANDPAATVDCPGNSRFSDDTQHPGDTGQDDILNDDTHSWTTVVRTQAKKSSWVKPRMVGTKQPDAGRFKVVSVPRRLTVFVGRLHNDTSEDDLKEFLTDAGIQDVRCKRLKAKGDKKYNTAAFCVSCPDTYRTLFYDEATWPTGCELRDWYFKDSVRRQPDM